MFGLLLLTSIGLTAAQIIDLGYSKVQVSTSYKGINAWFNIRYAAPPLKDLRFAAPAKPVKESSVNTGVTTFTCPMPTKTTSGNFSSILFSKEAEDCLFLDVFAPANITETAQLPVMVWIYGGGYTTGTKDDYPGFGLIEASENKMIYVTFNYRLGAFGFSAGPTFTGQKGTPNVGLLDQVAALEWVQEYIHKFGGDPKKVTVAGESAGGSSIMFHLTADKGPLFQQAILQSPAFLPEFQPHYLDDVFETFANNAGCTDPNNALSCLRSKPEATLIAAAKKQVAAGAVYSTFTYGPSVDDAYVSALPTIEVYRGASFQIPLLLSFTSHEAIPFVDPKVQTADQFNALIDGYLPYLAEMSASNAASFKSAVQRLYPISAYKDEQARLTQLIGDVIVGCNVYTMASASPTSSWVYEWNVGTAWHASDVLSTFFNAYEFRGFSSASLGVKNVKTAQIQQMAITTFVLAGSPGFAAYGTTSTIKVINDNTVDTMKDPNDNERCRFWRDASYDPDSAKVPSKTKSGASTTTTADAKNSASLITPSIAILLAALMA